MFVTDSLSNGEVAAITAVICCVISIVITATVTFFITTYYYKKKHFNEQVVKKQPMVSQTDVVEYEEITKISADNVTMNKNPAYGYNVKKTGEFKDSDYYI